VSTGSSVAKWVLPIWRRGCGALEPLAPQVAYRANRAMLGRALFTDLDRFERAVADPAAARRRYLAKALDCVRGTAFARDHGLTPSDTIASYLEKVPVRDYDALAAYVRRIVDGEADVLAPGRPQTFAKTSGSTGRTKLIPYWWLGEWADSMCRQLLIWQVIQKLPAVGVRPVLYVRSSSPDERTAQGIPIGNRKPSSFAGGRWFRDAVPAPFFFIEDLDLRHHAVLRLAAQGDVGAIAVANPSTLVLLAKKLAELAEPLAAELESGGFSRLGELPACLQGHMRRSLRRAPEAAARLRAARGGGPGLATELWPGLTVLIGWLGGNAGLYRTQLSQQYPGVPCWDPGYDATEAYFALPLDAETPAGVCNVWSSIVEFLPPDDPGGQPRFAEDLEVGGRYRVVVTNAVNGLFRYDMADLAECVGYFRKTACIRFIGRGRDTISFTGEKLTQPQIVAALGPTQGRAGRHLEYCVVAGEFADPARLLWGVECDPPPNEAERGQLSRLFDAALCEVNAEYEAKRRSGRLDAPRVVLLRRGTAERLYRERSASGAQEGRIKLPTVVESPEWILSLADPGTSGDPAPAAQP
jgi:hypothetical protein